MRPLLPARCLLTAVCVLTAIPMALDAHAIVIDNFEEGVFSLQANPGSSDSGSQSLTVPTNAVASPREVTIFSNADFCSADLTISTTLDDEIQMVMGNGGGLLELLYRPGGVDLTGGGVFNRIDVDLTVAVPVGSVRLELVDVAGNAQEVGKAITGPGKLIFPFSEFTLVNLEEIQDIRVRLSTNSEGDYHLTDIRVTESPDQDAAADYVIENVLGGDVGQVTLWSHEAPVDDTHVLRTVDPRDPDRELPYPMNWVFMVDDNPGANWAHPVRWVVINSDLGEHVVYEQDWFPSIVSEGGGGPLVDFGCIGATEIECSPTGPFLPGGVDDILPGFQDGCLYAVLVSGGWTDSSNYSRYAENLTSMYQRLRQIGYKKSNIWTYYADGSLPLDLDNIDGDNNHFTGNDVTAGATEAGIREQIQLLCQNLNPTTDVLFIYTSNHGVSNGSLMLWDFNSNGQWEDNEFYSPAELASDTENCQVCRNFVLVDQCYSGAFLPMANDGNHPRTAVYAAATANEVSWGREYMDWWEDLDIDNSAMNDLHQSVANSGTLQSTAVFSQTTAQTGEVTLDYCWGEEIFHVPSDRSFCGLAGGLDIEVAICNELPSTQRYELSFQGLPAGLGCDVPGPTNFAISESNPIYVGPGECKTVTVTIGRPSSEGLLTWTACYEATLTNLDLGFTRKTTGRVSGSEVPIFCLEPPREQHVWLNPLDLVTVEFVVQNPGEDMVFDYQFDAVASDGLAQNTAISLNEMDPGEPVSGSVFIPSGADQPLTVDVILTDRNSNIFYDLQLMSASLGKVKLVSSGEKRVSDVLGSVGLRKFGEVTTALDPTPRRGPVEIEIFPNPFNPRTEISFRTPFDGEVDVTVLDARGRRVRTLHTGPLSAGTQSFTWDGVDDASRQVASGTYFVRVSTLEGVTVQKAALLK